MVSGVYMHVCLHARNVRVSLNTCLASKVESFSKHSSEDTGTDSCKSLRVWRKAAPSYLKRKDNSFSQLSWPCIKCSSIQEAVNKLWNRSGWVESHFSRVAVFPSSPLIINPKPFVLVQLRVQIRQVNSELDCLLSILRALMMGVRQLVRSQTQTLRQRDTGEMWLFTGATLSALGEKRHHTYGTNTSVIKKKTCTLHMLMSNL